MIAFWGATKTAPSYVMWLMERLGSEKLVHFRETRPPVGQEEAKQLLQLKTKRGGAERLATVQRTVKSLLGVNVDAFEPESSSPMSRQPAEMDIDEFLVEANGAGIRESLRIVLDIELKEPSIVLIEEPEVHLHPGLERALHSYLVSKKSQAQIFVSTHSSNFVDVSDQQSVFILSRNEKKLTSIERIGSYEEAVKIPAEIGLRPSTVLMYDKLVFVEGVSDEDILRAFCETLKLDLSGSTVAFVRMGGVGNYPHYAVEATLNLLSRRQIPMWFVVDRDEREDSDIAKMAQKLGNKAELVALRRREIENYLLDDASAVQRLIEEKKQTSEDKKAPTPDEVSAEIRSVASALLDHVVNAKVSRIALAPIYPERAEGEFEERISSCADTLMSRLKDIKTQRERLNEELGGTWARDALSIAPGSVILERVFQTYGLSYRKSTDSVRIAKYMAAPKIDPELVAILKKISVAT